MKSIPRNKNNFSKALLVLNKCIVKKPTIKSQKPKDSYCFLTFPYNLPIIKRTISVNYFNLPSIMRKNAENFLNLFSTMRKKRKTNLTYLFYDA